MTCSKRRSNQLKTHEEYIRETYEKYGDEYTILGEYVNAKTGILTRHNKCGHVWAGVPNGILGGKACPPCGMERSRKASEKTYEDFLSEAMLADDFHDYEILGEYVNASTPILTRHKVCGNEYMMTPGRFTGGISRCLKCSRKRSADKRRIDHDEFIRRASKLEHANEYKFTSKYVSSSDKMSIVHKDCGHEYEVTPNNFLKGRKCPKCAGALPITEEEYIEIIDNKLSNASRHSIKAQLRRVAIGDRKAYRGIKVKYVNKGYEKCKHYY